MIPKVLDATCGSRMTWFDKDDERVLFVDRRELDNEPIWTSGDGEKTRYITISPDVIADFTDMPFPDDTFYHVFFDPPHMVSLGANSWMAKKYGRLDETTWQYTLRAGFDECMRVLKPNGTLVFKWNEYDIPVKDVIDAIGHKPLYGNRSGKLGKTHWMVFIKEVTP